MDAIVKFYKFWFMGDWNISAKWDIVNGLWTQWLQFVVTDNGDIVCQIISAVVLGILFYKFKVNFRFWAEEYPHYINFLVWVGIVIGLMGFFGLVRMCMFMAPAILGCGLILCSLGGWVWVVLITALLVRDVCKFLNRVWTSPCADGLPE